VILALDVDYRSDAAVTACVGWDAWTDSAPAHELVVRSAVPPAEYAPGRFFERELPYLQGALAQLGHPADLVVIDGYVWLGADTPGLGAHLHAVTRTPVVGVAKTRFRGAPAIEIVRGSSKAPLYVTAVGIDPVQAAEHVRSMHGPFRIPTLLKRADSLARTPP
jgi:deoxyribonuclease V